MKGTNIPTPSVPESFKVLLKELQSLGLDMTLLLDDGTEVEVKENIEYSDRDARAVFEGHRDFLSKSDAGNYGKYGYSVQAFNEQGELEEAEPEFPGEKEDSYLTDDYTDFTSDEE